MTGLCQGKPPQRASDAESVSILLRHQTVICLISAMLSYEQRKLLHPGIFALQVHQQAVNLRRQEAHQVQPQWSLGVRGSGEHRAVQPRCHGVWAA